jgi:hypothetical protein
MYCSKCGNQKTAGVCAVCQANKGNDLTSGAKSNLLAGKALGLVWLAFLFLITGILALVAMSSANESAINTTKAESLQSDQIEAIDKATELRLEAVAEMQKYYDCPYPQPAYFTTHPICNSWRDNSERLDEESKVFSDTSARIGGEIAEVSQIADDLRSRSETFTLLALSTFVLGLGGYLFLRSRNMRSQRLLKDKAK